jgi:hypothetical protein
MVVIGSAALSVWAVVEMIKREAVSLPLGVTVAGSNPQFARFGKPEHSNFTGALNPFCGVTVMAYAADCPALTVLVVSAAVTAKSGGLVTVIIIAAEVLGTYKLSPLYLAVRLCDPRDSPEV